MDFTSGKGASITRSGIVVASFYQWTLIERVAWHPSTPFGFLMDKFTAGTRSAVGGLQSFHDASQATPPSPEITGPATLTLTLSSGKTKVFSASLVQCHIQASSQNGGPPVVFDYAFIANAAVSTDTIVTA